MLRGGSRRLAAGEPIQILDREEQTPATSFPSLEPPLLVSTADRLPREARVVRRGFDRHEALGGGALGLEDAGEGLSDPLHVGSDSSKEKVVIALP